MENVITLDKLIGLLFCLSSSLLFFDENSKNTKNELARPVIGTIFLVTTSSDKREWCALKGNVQTAQQGMRFWRKY